MDGYDLITMSLTFDIWLRRPRLTFNNKFIYLLMDLVPSAMFLDVLNFRYFSLLTPFRDEFDTPALSSCGHGSKHWLNWPSLKEKALLRFFLPNLHSKCDLDGA